MSATCQRRYGPAPCRGALAFRTDHLGRLVVTCPRCARTDRGVCLDCPAPVAGPKSRRCRPCKRRAQAAERKRSYYRYPEKNRARARKYSTTHKAERAAYRRALRRRHLAEGRLQAFAAAVTTPR